MPWRVTRLIKTVMALGGIPAKPLPLVRQRFGAGGNGSCAYLVGRRERDRAPGHASLFRARCRPWEIVRSSRVRFVQVSLCVVKDSKQKRGSTQRNAVGIAVCCWRTVFAARWWRVEGKYDLWTVKTKRPGRTRMSQREVAEGITAVLSKHEARKEMETALKLTSLKRSELQAELEDIGAVGHGQWEVFRTLKLCGCTGASEQTRKEALNTQGCTSWWRGVVIFIMPGCSGWWALWRWTCVERSWRYSGRDSPNDKSRVRSVCSCHRQATLARWCSVAKQMFGYDRCTLNWCMKASVPSSEQWTTTSERSLRGQKAQALQSWRTRMAQWRIPLRE